MALTLPLPEVQGSRVNLGPELEQATFLIIPGVSDYVTGGYVISALNCRLRNIQSADVNGENATATGYTALCVFALAQIGTAGVTGYSQFLLKLLVVTTGVEVAPGASVSGAIWAVTVYGY